MLWKLIAALHPNSFEKPDKATLNAAVALVAFFEA